MALGVTLGQDGVDGGDLGLKSAGADALVVDDDVAVGDDISGVKVADFQIWSGSSSDEREEACRQGNETFGELHGGRGLDTEVTEEVMKKDEDEYFEGKSSRLYRMLPSPKP